MIACFVRIGRVPETAERIVAAWSAARQPTTWPTGARLRELVITTVSPLILHPTLLPRPRLLLPAVQAQLVYVPEA